MGSFTQWLTNIAYKNILKHSTRKMCIDHRKFTKNVLKFQFPWYFKLFLGELFNYISQNAALTFALKALPQQAPQ